MIKYKLMQDNEQIKFNSIEGYTELNNDNLKDIIKFTGMFKTPEELRMYLTKYDLVKTSKPFSISYKYGGNLRNLIYGVTYRDDLPFFTEQNLKIFLMRNKQNYEFLNKLCNYFCDSRVQGENVFLMRNYLKLLRRDEQAVLDDEREIVQDFDYAVDNFVKRECYRYDRNKRTYKENFRGLRDLAMYLSREAKRNDLIKDNMIPSNEFMDFVVDPPKKFDEILMKYKNE